MIRWQKVAIDAASAVTLSNKLLQLVNGAVYDEDVVMRRRRNENRKGEIK